MSDNKPYLIELSLYNKKNPFEINKFCSVSFDTSKVNLSKEKKNKILAELQEPTDLMVIPERVTPSGVELKEKKLHGGIGFENMLKMFDYNGMSIDKIRKDFFHEPKMIEQNVFEIIGNFAYNRGIHTVKRAAK